MVSSSLLRLLRDDWCLGQINYSAPHMPFRALGKHPLYLKGVYSGRKKKNNNNNTAVTEGHKTNYINLCLSIDFIQTSLHFVDVDVMNFSLLRTLGCDSLFIRNELKQLSLFFHLDLGHELCIFQLWLKAEFLSYLCLRSNLEREVELPGDREKWQSV